MQGGRRFAVRAAVVGLGLAGLVLTVPTFAATKEKKAAPAPPKPGKEKCCVIELDGLAGVVTAGGAPARFDLVVSRTDKGCTQTRRTITVRLKGLASEHIRLERVVSGQVLALRDTSTRTGTVEAVDPLVDSKLTCGEDTSVAARYRIAFLDGAPSGPAELIVSAHAVNDKPLGSARARTVVVAPASNTTAPPPKTMPPETAPPTTAPAVAESTAPPVPEDPAPAAPPADPPVARPPLQPAAETDRLATTLLTASIVLALSGMLLVGVLWRLRRKPAAAEVPTVTLPPGVGAELARLTEEGGAAGDSRPAAP